MTVNGNGRNRLLAIAGTVLVLLIGALGLMLQRELDHLNDRVDAIRDYVLAHEKER